MTALRKSEILMVVNRYIGVAGGYLGDFTYATFEEFFPEYCDLDIDPYQFDGHTTRYRFISILQGTGPRDQARILRGVLEKYPPGSSEHRTEEAARAVTALIERIERQPSVALATPGVSSDIVRRAIADADQLLRTRDATSGIDRMHTAFHGYLRTLAADAGLDSPADASATKLYRDLRENHPRLRDLGDHAKDVDRILRSFAGAVDALNTLRNKASVAHPNDQLLRQEEASLYVNAVRTIMDYLDARLAND